MNTTWAEPSAIDREQHDPAEVFEAGLRNHHVANTAYPIAHQRTFKPYRLPQRRHFERAIAAFVGVSDLCLYVHVPFCETRCSFCEYTVVDKREASRTGTYVDALLVELNRYADELALAGRRVHGLDVGGGTPSFLSLHELERIVAGVHARCRFAPGADISIETTPKLAAADPDKLVGYKQLGIDRISMGVQVLQPDLLKMLARSDNGAEQHVRAVEAIRKAGFARFNVDLMYGFAGQSLSSWQATLEHAIALLPESITIYRMRYKLTRISDQASAVALDQVRPMAKLAKQVLAGAGYHANPGKTTYSKIPGDVGTSSYLARRVQEGMPYLGVGLGSQTFSPTTIAYNEGAASKRLEPYLEAVAAGRLPIQDLYDLPRRHVIGKMTAVSFYFGEIRRAPFAAKFGEPIEQLFAPEVELVTARGLMTLGPDALSLTDEGAAFVNGIIPLFAAPSIQRYLLERDPDRADDMTRNRRAALHVAR